MGRAPIPEAGITCVVCVTTPCGRRWRAGRLCRVTCRRGSPRVWDRPGSENIVRVSLPPLSPSFRPDRKPAHWQRAQRHPSLLVYKINSIPFNIRQNVYTKAKKRRKKKCAKKSARTRIFVYSEKLRPRPAGGRGGSSPTTQTRKTLSVRTKTRSSVSSGTSLKRRLLDSLRYNAACEHAMLLPELPTRPTTPWKSRGRKMVTCAYDSYILIRKTPFSSRRRCRRRRRVSEPTMKR